MLAFLVPQESYLALRNPLVRDEFVLCSLFFKHFTKQDLIFSFLEALALGVSIVYRSTYALLFSNAVENDLRLQNLQVFETT